MGFGLVFWGKDVGGVSISIVVLSVALSVVVLISNDIKHEGLATLKTHGRLAGTNSVPQQDVLGVLGSSYLNCYYLLLFVS